MSPKKRTKSKIPFNIHFGKIPTVFIGREEIREEIIDSFYEDNGVYRTSFITGLRGMGKTVLLTDIALNLKSEKDWVVVNTASSDKFLENILGNLQLEASEKLASFTDLIQSINLSFPGFGVGFGRTSPETPKNFQSLVLKLVRALDENGIGVLFTIDEVTNSEQMREFATTYQLLVRENYDICLLMAGLPQNIDELLSDDVLTFLRRATRIELSNLDISAVSLTYN